jgi:hypothetical protein
MKILAEGDLQIILPAGAIGRKFDDGKTHGLSHCMKAVDFIVEMEDRVWFVELKDPENPNSQNRNGTAFLKKFQSGEIDQDLKTKYRDSWLYEWAYDRVEKPIYFYVLIAASTLSSAELVTRTDSLKRLIPSEGPSDRPLKRSLIAGCAVMNLEAWNRNMPKFSVRRISQKAN